VLTSLPEGEIFVQDAPMLRSALPGSERKVKWSSEGSAPEPAQATISLCQALIAQTGSILVAASDGGRGASVVAPVHVVVATRYQLVADLETGLRRVQDSGAVANNSFLCVITGSSRTADIEKILVLGAHGPRRVVLILQS
jgi:L-lactate dehydrogenase complex protein LldG